MKQKAKSLNRPRPVFHMMRWGFGSGWLLALLFLMFFWEMMWVGLDGIAGLAQEPLALLTNPLIWLGSFIAGAMPGTMLGMLSGFILRQLTQNLPLPFTRSDMQAIRISVYSWIGISSFFAQLLWIGFFFGFIWLLSPVLLLPSLIAGIASAYAAHRYLFRLRLWSEEEYGIEKAKNVERLIDHLEDKAKNEHLEDKVKVDEMDFDDGNNGKEEKIQRLS